MYRNISGTTSSSKAMKFACSDTVPCSNIVLTNINLERKDGTVETYCNSAQGFGYGVVRPTADCLNSHDNKDKTYYSVTQQFENDYQLIKPVEEDTLLSSSKDEIIHTEL